MNFMMLDIETTGLDPEDDEILEISAFPINLSTLERIGEVFCERRHFVLTEDKKNFYSEVVVQMHTDNGLWQECESSITTETELLEKLGDYFFDILKDDNVDRSVILVGNSVHFDRDFIIQRNTRSRLHPAISLSHRVVDVRSIAYAMEAWWPSDFEPKTSNHRSLDDCYRSLEILRHYRSRFPTPNPFK